MTYWNFNRASRTCKAKSKTVAERIADAVTRIDGRIKRPTVTWDDGCRPAWTLRGVAYDRFEATYVSVRRDGKVLVQVPSGGHGHGYFVARAANRWTDEAILEAAQAYVAAARRESHRNREWDRTFRDRERFSKLAKRIAKRLPESVTVRACDDGVSLSVSMKVTEAKGLKVALQRLRDAIA